MVNEVLTKEEALELLRQHRKDLKKYGVKRIGLFGSFAGGQQKGGSDIDLVVEFDESLFGKDLNGLFDAYIALSNHLGQLFKRKVDILTPISIETIRIKEVREDIKKSVIYV